MVDDALVSDGDDLPTQRQTWVLTGAALALMVPILLPILVSISPVVYFDVDPRSTAGRAPITTIGPAGAAWLHVLSLVIAAGAIAVSAWVHGKARQSACILFAIGAATATVHLGGTFDDRLQSGAWIAAAAVGLAAAHLARHDIARQWMVAAAIASLAPMMLQAAWYVLVEHPMTVEMFLGNEEEVLRSRGWEAGSPQHELYRRRLTDASAVGAFGLSNVLGSIAAALSLLSAGVACVLLARNLRAGFQPGRAVMWALLPVAVTLMGGAVLYMTQSKGAVLAAMAGVGLLALVMLAMRVRPLRRWLPTAAVTLVFMAIVAVGVRGYFGPPPPEVGVEGERSLLFRWHYAQAAGRTVLAETPASLITGVGPTGFNQAYLQHKNPLNPEEITSTHSVFIDFIVMLGLGGVAWGLLLIGWLWQGGVAAARVPDATGDADAVGPPTLTSAEILPAAALATVLFATQYGMQFNQLLIETALLWLIGLLGFVGITAGVVSMTRTAPRALTIGAFVAAATLLVHTQIEMTFFHLPSTATAWGLVGMAAAGSIRPRRLRGADSPPPARLPALIPSAVLLAGALAMAVGYAAPISAHQSHLAAAAGALQQGHMVPASRELDAAAAILPADARTLRWRVQLRLDFVYHLAAVGRASDARSVLEEARLIIEQGQAAGLIGPAPYRLLASIEGAAAETLLQPQRRLAAVEALQQAVALSPYNLNDHLRLADLLWDLDQQAAAADHYRRALELSDLNYLDPAKQLTPVQRDHVERRLREAPVSASPPPSSPAADSPPVP